MDKLLTEIKKCTLCRSFLPLAPRPILNFSQSAKILIVGQAPGIKAHTSQTPWNDASGDRLRDWMGVDLETFYNEKLIAITPMGFCYPGKGKSGDLPPRPECSQKWMHQILSHLKNIELKIIIGSYARDYFIKESDQNLTEAVRYWKPGNKKIILLPHPSPRNNIWLKKNPWFEIQTLPALKRNVQKLLS